MDMTGSSDHYSYKSLTERRESNEDIHIWL